MTYYDTLSYDIAELTDTYSKSLVAAMQSVQLKSGVMERELPGMPGIMAYVPADADTLMTGPSETVVKQHARELELLAKINIGDTRAIRDLFKGEDLKMAISEEVLESMKNDLVDEIKILDGEKVLVILEKGDWTV